MGCASSSGGICQLDVVTGDGIWQVDSNGSRACICQVDWKLDYGKWWLVITGTDDSVCKLDIGTGDGIRQEEIARSSEGICQVHVVTHK